MSRPKHKSFRKEEKDGETQKLKNTIRRLQSDIRKLKSELNTYELAFQKNIEFLKGKTKNLSLEELVAGAKQDQNLEKIEQVKEENYADFKQKWKCHDCAINNPEMIGIMKITVLSRQDGKFYYRKCTNPKCKKRTEFKPFTDDVEIS